MKFNKDDKVFHKKYGSGIIIYVDEKDSNNVSDISKLKKEHKEQINYYNLYKNVLKEKENLEKENMSLAKKVQELEDQVQELKTGLPVNFKIGRFNNLEIDNDK